MTRLILLSFILCSAMTSLNGQALKGLKEKIAQRTANSLLKKTDKTSGDSTRKSSPFDMGNQKFDLSQFQTGLVDPSKLPDSYVFSHVYRIKMQSERGEMEMDYLLTRAGNYLANTIYSKGNKLATIVYDYERKFMINYFSGNSMAMKMPDVKDVSENEKDTVYTIEALPNKRFLGYDCMGKKMENENFILTIYIAPNLGVDMCNPFERENSSPNPAFRLNEKENSGGLVMYMKIIDKKNRGEESATATMECILFNEKETVIKNRK